MSSKNEYLKIQVDEEVFLQMSDQKDAPRFFELTEKNYNEFSKWFPWTETTKTVEDTKKYFLKCITLYQKGEDLDLGINYKGEWVGRIGLHGINKTKKIAEVGYWLDKDYEGKGIVSRSLQSFIKYSFMMLNLNKIKLRCAGTNESSKKVAERNGFKLEGVLRQEDVHPQLGTRDEIVYGLLRSDII